MVATVNTYRHGSNSKLPGVHVEEFHFLPKVTKVVTMSIYCYYCLLDNKEIDLTSYYSSLGYKPLQLL